MLKDLPPNFWKFFPLVISGMFIVSGIGLVIAGSVSYNKANDDDDILGFTEAGTNTASMLTISIGVTDFFTGLFGLGVVLLNKKWLFMGYAGFLALMLLGNLFAFYALISVSNEDFRKTSNILQEMTITLYGNNSRTDGQQYTDLVNKLQSETPCCGFSANEKENIFLKTTWHQKINVNIKGVNLPDSCCKVHGDNCRGVTDMAAGRASGNVHKNDCINELYKNFSSQMFLVFVEVALSTLMQVVAAGYMALFLMYGPECPKD